MENQEFTKKLYDNIENKGTSILNYLNASQQQLISYYEGGAQDNGMSYRQMLKIYDNIENAIILFTNINEKIKKELKFKLNNNIIIPKRKI